MKLHNNRFSHELFANIKISCLSQCVNAIYRTQLTFTTVIIQRIFFFLDEERRIDGIELHKQLIPNNKFYRDIGLELSGCWLSVLHANHPSGYNKH